MSYAIPIFNFYHNAITIIIPLIILMCFVIKFFEDSIKNSMLFIMASYMITKVLFIIEHSKSARVVEESTEQAWLLLNDISNAIVSLLIISAVFLILFNKKKMATVSSLSVIVLSICLNCYAWQVNVNENDLYYIPEYSCIGLANDEIKDILEVNKYILEKEKEGYTVKILDIIASKYMIPLHRNNYKFDLMLNGNLGYNGEERLKEEIKSIENLLIMRQKPEVETIKIQQPEGIDKFIEENYQKVGEINNLEVFN